MSNFQCRKTIISYFVHCNSKYNYCYLPLTFYPAYARLWRTKFKNLSNDYICKVILRKQQALEYHSKGRPGKIEVVPTKEAKTQRDLSLAYSPGVAEPCKEIAANKENVYKYTAKGNLVAVISNGTAVLGLG